MRTPLPYRNFEVRAQDVNSRLLPTGRLSITLVPGFQNAQWSMVELIIIKLIIKQTDARLFVNNSRHCWMLQVASVCTPCCMLLRVAGSCCAKFETGQTFSQQLPTFLLFGDRRSVALQCWIRLQSSSNNVGATHASYIWSPKSCGLYSSHVALQVPTLLPNNVGNCCVRLQVA